MALFGDRHFLRWFSWNIRIVSWVTAVCVSSHSNGKFGTIVLQRSESEKSCPYRLLSRHIKLMLSALKSQFIHWLGSFTSCKEKATKWTWRIWNWILFTTFSWISSDHSFCIALWNHFMHQIAWFSTHISLKWILLILFHFRTPSISVMDGTISLSFICHCAITFQSRPDQPGRGRFAGGCSQSNAGSLSKAERDAAKNVEIVAQLREMSNCCGDRAKWNFERKISRWIVNFLWRFPVKMLKCLLAGSQLWPLSDKLWM